MMPVVPIIRRVAAESARMLSVCLVLGAMLGISSARAENLPDEQCREALRFFIGSGWTVERMPRADQCSPDIRLYVDYLATTKADGSDGNLQAQRDRLLAAADAGNRSAQILYTLLFTEIVDSKFLSEIVNNSSYSRYGGYIRAWYVLTKAPDMVKYEAGLALNDGIAEACIPLFAGRYFEWKQDGWPGNRSGAAACLLTAAEFYADREQVRPYLRKLMTASDSEMENFDGLASQYVGGLLIREETRYCRDKKCTADANIKRLICDIRSPNGISLIKLERDACDQVSAPLVRLYRSNVSGMITYIINSR